MAKHESLPQKRLRVDRIFLVGVLIVMIIEFFQTLLDGDVPKNVIEKYQAVKIPDSIVGEISESYQVESVPDKSLSISVIGDIMCHNTQYMDAKTGSGGYDFSHVFQDIQPYIESADLAIGNLETTFAGVGMGYSSYPTFNTPEHLALDLKEMGIDILSTANNHSLDKGYKGIDNTIKELDKVGIVHAGTYNSQEKANEIVTVESNGMKIAYLAYTYGTNGISIPSGKEYCINIINKDKIISDLKKAKGEKPDLIIVQMHWGNEYETSPNRTQTEMADLLFENGADIILGSHPHVLQKMEKRTIDLGNGKTKDGFVIYSLGNFVSGQYQKYTKQSIILQLKVTRKGNSGQVLVDSAEYVPIYTYKGNRYRILDMETVINNANNGNNPYGNSVVETLKTELNQVYSRMGDEIK